MNIYNVVSKAYDLLEIIFFSEKGKNPVNVILEMVPDRKIRVLDMCCGTLSNTITIAKEKPAVKVMGLDLSEQMLRVAKKKVNRQGMKNVYLKCADAAKTGLPDKSFDYIIIGLVLHESCPEFIKRIMAESNRLLKDEGNIVILEWERQKKFCKFIKFAPLYLLESLHCRTFKKFYLADKKMYFENYGFDVTREEHCNYTIVLKLKKRKGRIDNGNETSSGV